MQPVHVPSSSRALLDRPQRLGFVPTWWFWNDPERYRLALPLVLLLSLPLIPLTFFLVIRFQLHFLLIAVSSTFPPYVALGLIERHIRSELRRRERAGSEVGEALDQASPPDLLESAAGRRFYRVLGAFAGVATAVAVGQIWGALAAALTVLALALLIGAAWHLSPGTRALASDAAAAPMLARPSQSGEASPAGPPRRCDPRGRSDSVATAMALPRHYPEPLARPSQSGEASPARAPAAPRPSPVQ